MNTCLFLVPAEDAIPKLRTFAIFENINITDYNSKCYELHVFVMSEEAAFEWDERRILSPGGPRPMLDTIEDFCADEHYAGASSIFGRGRQCSNCLQRKLFDIRIDVTSVLKELGLELRNTHKNIFTYKYEYI